MRTRHEAPKPTRSVCVAASSLGVVLDDLAIEPRPRALMLPWRGGESIAIVGPSGSGKSTLLGDVVAHVKGRGERVVQLPRVVADKACIDLVGGEPVEAMRRLARAGLGDMRAFMCGAGQLSTGQRARLRLALAMQHAERCSRGGMATALVVDEFGATWDGATTRAMGMLLRRWLGEEGQQAVRVVVASTDEAAVAALRPAHVVRLDARGGAAVVAGASARPRLHVRIERGVAEDLAALAPLHYRAGSPATVVGVLVARVGGARAGVLAVSMPVLNATWRQVAWGDRFATGDRRRDAARINRELRCISRVIVEPAYRSMGIARRLVEHYLAAPMTRRTEALAAMGHAAPFFEAAGMCAYHLPPAQRHARLLDAFEHVGVEAWRLATPGLVLERLHARDRVGTQAFGATAFIERELRSWARRSGATASMAKGSVGALVEAAARLIVARPVAYAHCASGGR
ncbi:MAG: AAA family ATPase [Phycisphaerales bacterium]|nr:AAA family ATPase [Phycisphaerales bacterium]